MDLWKSMFTYPMSLWELSIQIISSLFGRKLRGVTWWICWFKEHIIFLRYHFKALLESVIIAIQIYVKRSAYVCNLKKPRLINGAVLPLWSTAFKLEVYISNLATKENTWIRVYELVSWIILRHKITWKKSWLKINNCLPAAFVESLV